MIGRRFMIIVRGRLHEGEEGCLRAGGTSRWVRSGIGREKLIYLKDSQTVWSGFRLLILDKELGWTLRWRIDARIVRRGLALLIMIIDGNERTGFIYIHFLNCS